VGVQADILELSPKILNVLNFSPGFKHDGLDIETMDKIPPTILSRNFQCARHKPEAYPELLIKWVSPFSTP